MDRPKSDLKPTHRITLMRRFFAEPERCKGSEIELDERESQHLALVHPQVGRFH